MATTIKDSVYKAIDVIVGKRIEDLHLDKTIEATVIKCVNLSDKKYELKYGSGVFYAYARQNEIYTPNSTVYVLVPENNFNKTKWIIGKANTGSQTNINESQSIATMTSGYSIIGKNILSYKTNNTTIGLNSDIGSQYIILYDAKQNNKANLINVNNEALKIYLQESQGFIFSAQFQSNLSKRQITGREDFGLIFNLRLKNGKTSFLTLQDRWEAQEPNTQCTIDNKEIRLNDLREKVEQLWTTTSVSEENIDYSNITIDFLQEQLSNYVIELQAFAQELTFLDDQTAELVKLYIQLIDDLSAYTLNNNNNPITVDDIINLYYEWFTNESYAFQETIYTVVLNTEKMTGNPYYLFSPTYQYTFSEIDPETFIGIESIYFYSECPSSTHNLANEMDIRITDIGISCIKYLDNINGDYRLDIKCSDIYFGQNASNETNITVTAKIFYQNNTDVTPYSRIMWFKQNNNITSSSANYSIYGGLGWQQLTTTTHNIFTTTAAQNLVYKNYYKVVAMYESGTIVQQEFIIYNEKHQHNIELSSDSGTSFGIGSGQKYITCLVDNQIDILHYQYNWYISANNNVQYKIKTQEELSELENEIKDISISLSDKAKKQQEFNVISNIIQLEDKNIIEVQSTALPLNGSINIICEVYTKDSQLLIGSANITLTNQRTINIKDYYIEIVNGNQAFQYNESGISPCSNVFEKPLIPLSLKCNFYDPMGGLINPLRYNTSWEIPIENTLIHTNTNNLTYNNVSGLNNLLTSDTCTFTISDEYNYNYTNNQIVCIVEFDDGNGLVSYRQPTNFFFGKIGDHGTNGTDIITKIHVVPNDSATIRDDYNNNTLLKEKLTLIIEQTNSDIEGEYNYNYIWNNGVITDYPILQLDLFKKNELIQPSEYRKVNWSVLTNGLSSKNWKTINNNTDNTKQVILQYDATKLSSNQNYTNYIIKAQADLPIDDNNFQTYYDFYPICTNLKYAAAAETNYTVGIDSARTLQYVTYNSDGRNPLYNKNLGVGLSFKNLDSPRTIVWESHGGISTQNKLESYPSFTIGKQISYIPSYSTEIQEYLNELEEQKTNALLEFKDNFNIFNQLNIEKNNQLDILNEEKQKLQDLEQTYQDNLNQDREKFNQTQKDNIDYGIQRLKERIVNIGALTTNVITLTNYTEQDGDSTNFNWFRIVSIDDAVNPVYSSDQDFIDELYLYCTTLNDETIQVLETKFKSLVFEVYFTNDTIENPKNANIIKEYFIKFINNTVLLGYKTNKKIFDSKHQDIYDNIELTSKKKESLIEQIEIYENTFINNENSQLIQYKPTEETIVDVADINILQGIIQNFDNPNNSIMQYSEIWNLIVSVQTQYHNNLNLIIQKYDTQINFLSGILTDDTDPTFCSVIPNEIYSGEYPNQYIKVKIYQGLIDKIDDTSILEHELIIPFHMSLNTYGLASLNAWDGNSVEINEDAGYVLAPQIGAGIKHPEDNTFTGILMGTEKTFDDAAGQEEIGLLGYSHGKRSIFLDAATGNATFGLPEDDSKDVSNPLTEGRIELRPGGTSSISKWNFDSRSLYRIASEDETEAIIKQRKYINQLSDTSLGEPYDDAPEYAHGSIPHTKQGILFSALPAYASFKGRVLTDEDHEKEKVEYTNANTTVRPGDTFELQIDPNDSKFFTLYEHSTRIYNGRGLYGTILDIFFATQLKWFEIDKDTQAEVGFYPRFKEYLGEGATYNEQTKIITLGENSKIKDINNTYFLVQRYVENNVYKYRVLSYLSKNEIDEWKWTIENCVLDNDCKITNEYAIATAKTYENWSIERTLQLVWTNIVFKADENIIENGVLVEVELDNDTNNILAITLPENNTIVTDATKVWHRYKKAGINALGEFSAESVGTGGLNLGLRGITAFDPNSAWVGPSFDSGSNTILKIFISEGATANKDDKAPVFISSSNALNTSNRQDDEGQRPIRIYAGQNYQPRGAGEKEYNTGIFVGKSAAQHPVNSIAKLEFDQTSSNDNKITLSALGSDIVENSSVLILQSSSDTNQQGSLTHTGDWKTEIGQNLNKTIHGDVNFVGEQNNNYTITGDFIGKFTNNTNTIEIQKNNIKFSNTFNNNNPSNYFTLANTTELVSRNQINIIGGNSNTSTVTRSLNLFAYHTSEGMRLTASKNIGKDAGDTTLQLVPGGTGTQGAAGARFYLHAGNHSYVDSSNKLNDPKVNNISPKGAKNGVIVGPNLQIGKAQPTGSDGHLYAGYIHGSGNYIKNTADGSGAGPGNSYTLKPGYGGTATFSVPQISVNNGRPSFTNHTISIQMPSEQKIDTSLKKHTHSLTGTYRALYRPGIPYGTLAIIGSTGSAGS